MVLQLTHEQLQALMVGGVGHKESHSKFKNRRFKDPDGGGFFWDSRAEWRNHDELRVRERVGEITQLTRQHLLYFWVGQPNPLTISRYVQQDARQYRRYMLKERMGMAVQGDIVPLPKRFHYAVDHRFWDPQVEKWRYQDTKGIRLPIYIFKKALVELTYPNITIEELPAR